MYKYGSRKLIEAFIEGLRTFKPTYKLNVEGETMYVPRYISKLYAEDIIKAIDAKHARIKTEQSILNNLKKENKTIDDIFGARVYGGYTTNKFNTKINEIKKILKEKGIELIGHNDFNKETYVGSNIKAKLKYGVPLEIQVSPGPIADFAQRMQHYAYKPELYGTTKFDQFVLNNLAKMILYPIRKMRQ